MGRTVGLVAEILLCVSCKWISCRCVWRMLIKSAWTGRQEGRRGKKTRIAVLTPSFAFYDYLTISVPPQTNTKKHKKTQKNNEKNQQTHSHTNTRWTDVAGTHFSLWISSVKGLYHSIHRLTVRQIWILLELVKKRREEKHWGQIKTFENICGSVLMTCR